MTTPITLTTDGRALCVRAAYKHRNIMLAIPKHLRHGVRDASGFWWRVSLRAYNLVAFALPDASVDYDVFVALDHVDTWTETARYSKSQKAIPKPAPDTMLLTPMVSDDMDKMVAFSNFAAQHVQAWQRNQNKRTRR